MKRRWCSASVATSVLLSLVVVLVICSVSVAATEQYVRISVTPKATVYAQFTDRQLRLATTAAGLANAKVIAAKSARFNVYTFEGITLPVSASALGNGWSGVKARFAVPGGRDNEDEHEVFAEIGPARKDAGGAEWVYWVRFISRTGATPANAPVMKVADLSTLKLKIGTRVSGRQLGVGVQVMAGKDEVSDITKNGRSADVLRVTVRDPGGKSVASATGPLSKFGFG